MPGDRHFFQRNLRASRRTNRHKTQYPDPHAFQRPNDHRNQCTLAISPGPKRYRSGPRVLPKNLQSSNDIAAASLGPGHQKVLSSLRTITTAAPAPQNSRKLPSALAPSRPLRFELTDSPQILEALQEPAANDGAGRHRVWTDAPVADAVLSLIRSSRPSIPVFLSRKAAQLDAASVRPAPSDQSNQYPTARALFTVDAPSPRRTPLRVHSGSAIWGKRGSPRLSGERTVRGCTLARRRTARHRGESGFVARLSGESRKVAKRRRKHALRSRGQQSAANSLSYNCSRPTRSKP